jgi:hypothetical protein
MATLEKAVQDKAKNDAAIDALGGKMKAVELLIKELEPKERNGNLSEGERRSLEALRKEKDELREEKMQLYAINLALINRLAILEVQQGAGTVQNVLPFSYCSLRGNMIYVMLWFYSYFHLPGFDKKASAN